jgi:hypothetical protein
VINRRNAQTAPTLRPDRSAPAPRSRQNAKKASLYFQSLAHSPQFTIPDIPSIFYTLRTLCQKHPGVPVDSPTNFSPTNESHLTPIESVSFTILACKPFGVLLFQNAAPVIPFESYCFANGGEEVVGKFPNSRATESQAPRCTDHRANVHSSNTSAGTAPPVPRHRDYTLEHFSAFNFGAAATGR